MPLKQRDGQVIARSFLSAAVTSSGGFWVLLFGVVFHPKDFIFTSCVLL